MILRLRFHESLARLSLGSHLPDRAPRLAGHSTCIARLACMVRHWEVVLLALASNVARPVENTSFTDIHVTFRNSHADSLTLIELFRKLHLAWCFCTASTSSNCFSNTSFRMAMRRWAQSHQKLFWWYPTTSDSKVMAVWPQGHKNHAIFAGSSPWILLWDVSVSTLWSYWAWLWEAYQLVKRGNGALVWDCPRWRMPISQAQKVRLLVEKRHSLQCSIGLWASRSGVSKQGGVCSQLKLWTHIFVVINKMQRGLSSLVQE